MGSTGVLPGGAPTPEPERVAMIRYTIVDEPATCAAFAEPARAHLAALNDQGLAETRAGDPAECAAVLVSARDRVSALDPVRLEPRRGLAGLFDSRGKRLKAFRAAYASAASTAGDAAADLGERGAALTRKNETLDTLWTQTRDAIADLDAHIAAARAWLAERAAAAPVAAEPPAPEPMPVAEPEAPTVAEAEPVTSHMTDAEPEPEAPPETVAEAESPPPAVEPAPVDEPAPEPDAPTAAAPEPEVSADPPAAEPAPEPEAAVAAAEPPEPTPEPAHDPAPVTSLPHPLETRLAALTALRAEAINRLPLLRAAQNADWRAPSALADVREALDAWRTDWSEALGLAGKKPKKVRPDPARLTEAQTALAARLAAADRELTAAQARRAELDERAALPWARMAA